MTDEKTEIGRLALRHEGEWWNAYWAPHQHDMDGALLIGSIRFSLVHGAIKELFISVMCEAFTVVVKDVTGDNPTWGKPHSAPESEKSGHG
jgi:hypothetical protein